ncbi:macro domain-containing protein RSc0334-like [Pollicipes pollicipes]|uniref:macro domain-containing protein RSc0334-like n=1 Tax=Pollicipes pollicipes TaxID=41117 RepID=UPI001884BE2D|nr:macro domain-containing protein RSc0334-like [Pollicipes pollicipes]
MSTFESSGTDFKAVRQSLLAERRRNYRCGNNYVTLSSIPTWLQHSREKVAGAPSEAAAVSPSNKLADKVSLWRGDITRLELDAVVNAANRSLLGGGGVDGAIHAAAGPQLRAECAALRGCDTGEVKLTQGYRLPARHVLHTVGPVGEKPDLLRRCYAGCLELARRHGLRSLAFPCVSTGVFGYPNEAAARVALATVRTELEQHADELDRVVFCLFLEQDVKAYQRLMPVFFPLEDGA